MVISAMKLYRGGSEWRKWDLHVHLPGTNLSNGYAAKDGKPDWGRFADTLEASDVAVFGVTDYFTVKNILEFTRFFRDRFPQSQKLLLPNVELRLNETVNGAGELVHFHVVFRENVDEKHVREFLAELRTQITVSGQKKLSCADLSTKAHFETATVSRDDLHEAFKRAFGQKAEETDHLIYLAPAKNDGLRAQGGSKRKAALSDEIDKTVHAIFGGSGNREYFLDRSRYEDETQRAAAKPVFSGSDAHSFEQLDEWLGQDVDAKGVRKEVTWIKADLTFEGLQQTLIEPSERVAIQPVKPDEKDPYKVIKALHFSSTDDFPRTLTLNPNLNAIIGSRSSGKSALLAHIAHAVDPEYTVRQQVMATHQKESEVGPAAGKTWKSVAATKCQVEWADSSAVTGSVIYVPQNWLYEISDNAAEVTAKIQPALELNYREFSREHTRLLGVVSHANSAIGQIVDRWFSLADEIQEIGADIRKVGDKKAIEGTRDELGSEIDRVRKQNQLSEEDLRKYQEVIAQAASQKTRVAQIDEEQAQLDPYVLVEDSSYIANPGSVRIDIETTPELVDLPEDVAEKFAAASSRIEKQLVAELEGIVVSRRTALKVERERVAGERSQLIEDNKVLIDKHKANRALDDLVKKRNEQIDALKSIETLEARRAARTQALEVQEGKLREQLDARLAAFGGLTTLFAVEPRTLDDLTFGQEIGFPKEDVRRLSEAFRKSEAGTFITKNADDDAVVDVAKAQSDAPAFMNALRSGSQKLNTGYGKPAVAADVLKASPEVRFTAELESDVIGGFQKSTMTPGKQALFALTLILNEAQDSWPLLIDQPEDDLDSRSIYGAIVPYLLRRKKERQVIMVTHNANLVVGADAEEVIVANRHGDDSKNRDDRTFDYLTGSLEHSATAKSKFALEKMGIREHTCEILDGGEEAFHKRAEKYKL